jgi:hypothetical protein
MAEPRAAGADGRLALQPQAGMRRAPGARKRPEPTQGSCSRRRRGEWLSDRKLTVQQAWIERVKVARS